MTTAPQHMKELAHRAAAGVEVALFWNLRTDELSVVVDDARNGDAFEIPVAATEALDAFNHPYAYAARAGVEYAGANREPVYA